MAAAFCPFVGLSRQDASDKVDDRISVREDAHRVRVLTDLEVEALVGAFRPDLVPDVPRDACGREDVSARDLESLGDRG